MKLVADPVGEFNDFVVHFAVAKADMVVCAWGRHGAHMGRGGIVRRALIEDGPEAAVKLHYLALNADGSPKHPLYIPDVTDPTPWGPVS